MYKILYTDKKWEVKCPEGMPFLIILHDTTLDKFYYMNDEGTKFEARGPYTGKIQEGPKKFSNRARYFLQLAREYEQSLRYTVTIKDPIRKTEKPIKNSLGEVLIFETEESARQFGETAVKFNEDQYLSYDVQLFIPQVSVSN